MKVERLLAIIIKLLNTNRITAKKLAEEFEVSVRTIQKGYRIN
ncbi:HTH domain-containing protein [Rossellomorea sp. y25]